MPFLRHSSSRAASLSRPRRLPPHASSRPALSHRMISAIMFSQKNPPPPQKHPPPPPPPPHPPLLSARYQHVADVIRSVGERLAADDVRAAVSPEEAVDKVLAMIQHFSRQSGDTLVNLAAVAPLMHECAAALHVFTTWPLPDNIWMRPLAELRAMSRAEICSAIAGLGPHDAYVKANGERALTSTSAQVCCCISL